MKPRREARLGPADAAALGPVALAGPGVQLVSDSDASHRRRSGPAGPGGPHSGREYNCRQRRLIPARPWVYLIRVTQVTVESSFIELLSGPWPGQLAVSASGQQRCFTLLQVWSRAARGSFEETYTNLNGMFWIFEIYLQSFTRAAS